MSVQQGRVTATFCPPNRVSSGRRCRDEPSLQRYCRISVWKRALDAQEAAACAASVWVFCDRMADSLISAFFIADKQHANVLEWPPLHHAAAVAFHVLQSRWGWGRRRARLSSQCPQANCQITSTWCICTLHVTRERKPAGSADRDQPKVKVRTMKYCIHACISGAKPAAEPLTPCYAPVLEAFTGLWETLNTLQRIQTSL